PRPDPPERQAVRRAERVRAQARHVRSARPRRSPARRQLTTPDPCSDEARRAAFARRCGCARDRDQPGAERAVALPGHEARAAVPRCHRTAGVPDALGTLPHRRQVEGPVVVSAAGPVGGGRGARAAGPGESARHALDGDLVAGRPHPRHARAAEHRLQRVARLHPHADPRGGVAVRPRRRGHDRLHHLMARRSAQGFAVAVVVALLGLLIWDLAHGSGSKVASEVASDKIIPAPPFTKSRVDTAGTLSLASLRGKVVVLNFWQSYCAPCTQEARTLADSYRQWQHRDVVFVGVDEQDLRGPALKFLRRFDITYPIVADNLSL